MTPALSRRLGGRDGGKLVHKLQHKLYESGGEEGGADCDLSTHADIVGSPRHGMYNLDEWESVELHDGVDAGINGGVSDCGARDALHGRVPHDAVDDGDLDQLPSAEPVARHIPRPSHDLANDNGDDRDALLRVDDEVFHYHDVGLVRAPFASCAVTQLPGENHGGASCFAQACDIAHPTDLVLYTWNIEGNHDLVDVGSDFHWDVLCLQEVSERFDAPGHILVRRPADYRSTAIVLNRRLIPHFSASDDQMPAPWREPCYKVWHLSYSLCTCRISALPLPPGPPRMHLW